ncbi:MAG: nitrous oxide reductase family maturation protein NosD [Promethearchaeota archaeon]
MKINCKTTLIILALGILIAGVGITNYSILNDQIGTVENRYKSNLTRPKRSAGYTTNFIHIDGSIPGNWTATTGYPWCYIDNGVYIIENVIIDASTSPTGSGIFIINSKNEYFIIRNCTVYNAGTVNEDAGIRLENTNNGVLTNNNCSNNGYFGINLHLNCENNTISGNIGSNNAVHGIRLQSYCIYNTLLGNTANENTGSGIRLRGGCENNLISGNTANDNFEQGIVLMQQCDNNTISGNIANGNNWGIRLDTNCNDNTVSGNTVLNNQYGIYLYTNCDGNTISGNTANYNTLDGIYLWYHCYYNTISQNTLFNNQYGIYLFQWSISNTISENIIYENDVYGIRLEGACDNNLIFNNIIFNNSNENARDININNWNNTLIGNYWGDYSGMDSNYDGIGDSPYNISGGNNKDYIPIMNYEPFFFKPPDDFTYEIGTEGHTFKWFVITTSMLPLTFNVFRDGISVKTGKLFTIVNEIEINVDGLDTGNHGFSIEVSDGYGGTYTNGISVTVINSNPVFTAIPNDFSYEEGSTGNNLSWKFSDISTNSPTYTITRNGVPIIIDNPCISGEPIEISVDGLNVGSHGFTIEIDDGYGGTVLDGVFVNVVSSSDLETTKLLYVEITDQSFSTEEFNITVSVNNESGHEINFATIQMWWDETEVSDAVVNLGNGLYFISLEPKTVALGEDPILLKMTISASGYEDKQFETYLVVDPDTLEKEIRKGAEGIPFVIILIAIISTTAGIGVATATAVLLRKRKRLTKV